MRIHSLKCYLLKTMYKLFSDCACGTGQHLLMLAELGLSVCGSDYSAANVKLRCKFGKHGNKIPLHQCDFRQLQEAYTEKFDAVVCLTTSLPHMHTDEDLLELSGQ